MQCHMGDRRGHHKDTQEQLWAVSQPHDSMALRTAQIGACCRPAVDEAPQVDGGEARGDGQQQVHDQQGRQQSAAAGRREEACATNRSARRRRSCAPALDIVASWHTAALLALHRDGEPERTEGREDEGDEGGGDDLDAAAHLHAQQQRVAGRPEHVAADHLPARLLRLVLRPCAASDGIPQSCKGATDVGSVNLGCTAAVASLAHWSPVAQGEAQHKTSSRRTLRAELQLTRRRGTLRACCEWQGTRWATAVAPQLTGVHDEGLVLRKVLPDRAHHDHGHDARHHDHDHARVQDAEPVHLQGMSGSSASAWVSKRAATHHAAATALLLARGSQEIVMDRLCESCWTKRRLMRAVP